MGCLVDEYDECKKGFHSIQPLKQGVEYSFRGWGGEAKNTSHSIYRNRYDR